MGRTASADAPNIRPATTNATADEVVTSTSAPNAGPTANVISVAEPVAAFAPARLVSSTRNGVDAATADGIGLNSTALASTAASTNIGSVSSATSTAITSS